MNNLEPDDLEFQFRFDLAQIASMKANLIEPRAIAADYDQTTDTIVIRLKSGAIFSFPPSIAQGLSGASPSDLEQIEITPMGDGLHWEKLDADFTVLGLLSGVFGTRKWMSTLEMQWIRNAG